MTFTAQLDLVLSRSYPDDATANTQGECAKNYWDWIVRRWTMNLLARVVMWGLLLCFPVWANAAEADQGFEVGIGLICNSEAQVQRAGGRHDTNLLAAHECNCGKRASSRIVFFVVNKLDRAAK